jgi:hypothetical protein
VHRHWVNSSCGLQQVVQPTAGSWSYGYALASLEPSLRHNMLRQVAKTGVSHAKDCMQSR